MRDVVLRFCFFQVLFVFTFMATAEEPLVPVDQRLYADSVNACGPATIMNLLRFGPPEFREIEQALVGSSDTMKLRFLIDRYFRNRPSTVYPKQSRWGIHGIDSDDLVAGVNELLVENEQLPLIAIHLDRQEGETGREQLARVHEQISRSLEDGVAPLVNLRSFYVKRREESGREPKWELAASHYVLVTALKDAPTAVGFEVEVIDPWKGRRSSLYLHREANGQPFFALKGNELTGEWLGGAPFLQVLAPEVPSMRPANVEWADRFIVVATFMLGRGSAVPSQE